MNLSAYAYAWNNPVLRNDPTGLCPDCPDPSTAKEGDKANPHGNREYAFSGGEWTADGETLNEVTVTASKFEGEEMNADTPLELGNRANLRALKDIGTGADYAAGVIGLTQAGMLEYRMSLPLSSKIGTFSSFSRTYQGLGVASKTLGRVGYAAAGVGVYLDYKSMKSGEISIGRFGYRTGSLGASVGTGAAVGGPWGAAAGALVGGVSIGAEYVYDSFLVPIGREISYQIWNFEKALKNGWYPGR